MNKTNFAKEEDKGLLKALYHQRLSFYHENYIEYYFNNEYDNDYHYVLKDDDGNILCYINRHLTSLKFENKIIGVSILRNFIYEDKESLYELLKEIEDHLEHQELITFIEDKDNIFDLDTYASFNLFDFDDVDFDISSYLHLFEVVTPCELLELYGSFVKRFNGYEVRDLKYFENKIKESIATSSKYLLFKENNKNYGYAHLYKNTVDEIIYFKKDVIDEVLTYLFVNYDYASIKTSSLEAINKVYKCNKKTKINLKYQINNLELLTKLYSLSEEEVKKLLSSNIFYL